MRMRRKPNLIPRMERCASVKIDAPQELKGKWREKFAGDKELWLELGCGKGRFTANTAKENPNAFIVAVEKVPDVMVMAMERVFDDGIENVQFIDADVVILPEVFEKGEVDRIFINFCDPWPKNRAAKHRLTSPGFLHLYEQILKPEGEIHFKTDNDPLFEYSVEVMTEEGYTLNELTRDLHANGEVGVMTDYEEKFHNLGKSINRLVAKKEIK